MDCLKNCLSAYSYREFDKPEERSCCTRIVTSILNCFSSEKPKLTREEAGLKITRLAHNFLDKRRGLQNDLAISTAELETLKRKQETYFSTASKIQELQADCHSIREELAAKGERYTGAWGLFQTITEVVGSALGGSTREDLEDMLTDSSDALRSEETALSEIGTLSDIEKQITLNQRRVIMLAEKLRSKLSQAGAGTGAGAGVVSESRIDERPSSIKSPQRKMLEVIDEHTSEAVTTIFSALFSQCDPDIVKTWSFNEGNGSYSLELKQSIKVWMPNEAGEPTLHGSLLVLDKRVMGSISRKEKAIHFSKGCTGELGVSLGGEREIIAAVNKISASQSGRSSSIDITGSYSWFPSTTVSKDIGKILTDWTNPANRRSSDFKYSLANKGMEHVSTETPLGAGVGLT